MKFEELKAHVGHELECVVYGDKYAVNASVECITCGTVLFDKSKAEEEEEA